MFKNILSLFLLFFIISCDKKQENKNKKDIFPIDFVKENSQKRKFHYNIDSLDLKKLYRIDTVFFKKWFDKKTYSFDSKNAIKFDPDSKYYFLEYFDNSFFYFYFTIVQKNEYCCVDLFHFKYEIKNNKFVQIDFIASLVKDGGEFTNQILDFNKMGDTLIVKTMSTMTNDARNGYVYFDYDSTVTEILFGGPITKMKNIFTVTKIDSSAENQE
jgi:hypothetical protein